MRIRWTSVTKVLRGNPVAPWVGPGVVDRMKQEGPNNGKPNEGQAKSDRSRNVWARFMKKEESSK